MIRATCPHCQLAQEFPDDRAGLEVPCEWCEEPLTVGGPDAEHIPDATEPPVASVGQIVGQLLAVVALGLFAFALIGLPVLDFGFGQRIGSVRPTESFWLVLLVAYGLHWLAERLTGRVTAV